MGEDGPVGVQGQEADPVPGVGAGSGEGPGASLLKSLLVIALSVGGFVFAPDRLYSYLAPHMNPRALDSLVLLWVAVFFVFLTWLFVRLQPRGKTA